MKRRFRERDQMFRTCTHEDIASSLETISAAFAIFEMREEKLGSSVLVSANSLFQEVSARSVIDCIGLSLGEFLPRYIEKQMRFSMELSVAENRPKDAEVVIEREGASRWWRFVVSPLIADGGGNRRMIVTMIEITEKKLLEQKLDVARQRFEAVVETAYDGIITIDKDQKIRMINEAAREIFGIAGGMPVVGEDLRTIIPQRFRDSHAQYVDSFRHSPTAVRPMQPRSSVHGLRRDGSEVPLEVPISKIQVDGEMEMTAVIRDISERTKLIERLQQAATHDALTGIFNRRHGNAMLTSEIHRCQRFGHSLTVAMFDLDQFKAVNDAYGHACGDLVLTSVVDTVSKTLRDIDVFCRWGGEEFLVVLPETVLDDAVRWTERVREAVASHPIVQTGQEPVSITASFGLSALSGEDTRLEDLLKRADEALYFAKESGRNRVCTSPRQYTER
ncbi:MAG: diguanylate cyclase [Rhodocyclaceae bacterium]|nr:diguanylate cyclase [Rhodocyclaceae bacterium]